MPQINQAASTPGPLNATSQAHCDPGHARSACLQLDDMHRLAGRRR